MVIIMTQYPRSKSNLDIIFVMGIKLGLRSSKILFKFEIFKFINLSHSSHIRSHVLSFISLASKNLMGATICVAFEVALIVCL
jgi:hypothetical protein